MDDMTTFERQVADEIFRIVGPARPVDDIAIFEVAASRSRKGGFTMFSALKLVAAGAIVALFGSFLLAGVLMTPEVQEPVPALESQSPVATGVEILSFVVGGTGVLGADGEGVVWAYEESQPGRLVRFVPDTGSLQTWSIEDDVAFGRMTTVSPSTGPGVWLVGPDRLRLFDGERFVEEVETPEKVTLAVETPDGALWAATESGSVLRWDGSAWEDLGPASAEVSSTGAAISALAVDSTGRAWIGSSAGVSVHDGSGWTTYDGSQAPPLLAAVNSMAEAPDGSIWVATDDGLARFDGSAWTDVTPEESGTIDLTSLLVTPDGTVWVGSEGWGADRFSVWRSDDSGWIEYGADEGLSALEPLASVPLTSVGDRVYVGTQSGAFAFSDGRWEPAWELSIDQFGLDRDLLAVDGDELWIGGQPLWHYVGGAWTLADDHPAATSHHLARAADGTLWAAGSDGTSRREGDRWVVVDETPAGAFTIDADGTIWAISESTETEGARQLWTLRFVGEDTVRDEIGELPLGPWTGGNSLAFDGTGVLWVGAHNEWSPGGLARYDGERWVVIDQIDGVEVYSASVLGSDPMGAMWVTFRPSVGADEIVPELSLVRFEGTDATIVELPPRNDWGEVALAPDGSPWVGSDRGPARWDGQGWTFPYEDIAVPGMGVLAVASDGSIFGVIDESIYRLAPRT